MHKYQLEEAFATGCQMGRNGQKKEETLHINVLELIAATFPILTFTKGQSNIAIHNKTALSYLLKMGGSTHNRQLLHIRKSIWNYLLSKHIALSAEYLPSTFRVPSLNVHTDWES